MTKISFVYFDVGGVLIKDFSASNKWEEMMLEMGIKKSDFPKFDFIYNRAARQINIHLAIDDLIPLLRQEFNVKIPHSISWLDYFVEKFDPNPSITSVVTSLNKTHRLGLLTNMWPGMLEKISTAQLMPEATWEVVVDSAVAKMQKPDREIYQFAQAKAGVPPEEILFIDNTQKHLVEPQKLRWQTFFYDSSNYENSSHELAKYLQPRGL